jgi:UDP-glucose 4-epimerase
MAGIPQVVHFSSGNVYASSSDLVKEDAALYPSVRAPFYLASKLVGDIYADFYRRTAGLRIATLRIASSYGPGMGSSGLIPDFVGRLLAGEDLIVKDGGRYGVDLVYVDDVVGAAMSAAERSAAGNFNIGSGERSTTQHVAEVLLRVTGAPSDALVIESASDQDSSTGHPGLDIVKARSELGFSPTPLATGLQLYVESRRSGLQK